MTEPVRTTSHSAVLAAVGLSVFIWAATPLVTKIAVGGLYPLAVGVWRTLLGALGAIPFVILGRLRLPVSGPGRAWLLVSALGGFVAFPILFSLGLGRTSAGHGALLLGVLPVLTGLFAALVERRLPGRSWALGCVLAVLGTAVLVGARFGLGAGEPGMEAHGRATWQGDVLVLLSAMAASTGYVAGALAAREAGTWAVTFWGLIIGAAVLLPFVPAVVSLDSLWNASGPIVFSIAYLAAGSSILAYAAWYWALGMGGIGHTGVTQFIQPLIGLVLAVAILNEELTWPMAVAAGAILGGVALARRRS